MSIEIIQGDCTTELAKLPAESVHCCVTSPPYWGLRDYGHDDQIGLETTPDKYVDRMVEVFREVRRVLRDDGTLWLNLGDSYATGGGAVGRCPGGGDQGERFLRMGHINTQPNRMPIAGLKPKDLVGIPWRVAFALQSDGWYLRQDVIWHKPNAMPESVRDRCTKAHEYIFLLSKSERYYYNADAIAEECVSDSTHDSIESRKERANEQAKSAPSSEMNGIRHSGNKKRKVNGGASFGKQNHSVEGTGAQSRTYERPVYEKRNRRSVWTVTTKPYKGAHFATFPEDLILPCILAGCPEGGTVLDPFCGSGTTLAVAERNGCNSIGIELNPKYVKLASSRCRQTSLFGGQ